MNKKDKSHILIVDDEHIELIALCQTIGEKYFDLSVAYNGEQALRIASATPAPDLILLDIGIPEMDGYEIYRQLKINPATINIPVIFITGLADEASEEKGMKLGAVDFITKPYRPAIVSARIQNHLELKRKLKLLDQLATQDSLTGIANRRRFEEYLHFEWLRAMRSQTMIALILMDVDHFKQFNDHYGHIAGDECLRKVATALADAMKRGGDFVARYGGEEFVGVLPETDLRGAATVAEQLRATVADLQITHEYSSVASFVTISIGVDATYPTSDNAPVNLMEAADKHLYQAKQAGRNRVYWRDRPEKHGKMDVSIENNAPDVRPQILIVDDERSQINVLGNMLKDHYTVSVALNGQQGLQRALMEPRPDIILLDIQMPDINGYEVCLQLKANPKTKGIPVIFMSVMSEEDDEAKGLEIGAVDYLTKPLKEAIVMARIKLHLSLQKTFQKLSHKNTLLEKQLRIKNT
ncbi:MAG: diguanylate cyclase [Gammaproteobacteria bacterium]|nr:diguanylate cyclase [Gammaproteobacteria bacterium]